MREFLIQISDEAYEHLEKRVAFHAAKGQTFTISEEATQEIEYARNRREALAKDAQNAGTGPRKCKHVPAGEVCAVCGREGRG